MKKAFADMVLMRTLLLPPTMYRINFNLECPLLKPISSHGWRQLGALLKYTLSNHRHPNL